MFTFSGCQPNLLSRPICVRVRRCLTESVSSSRPIVSVKHKVSCQKFVPLSERIIFSLRRPLRGLPACRGGNGGVCLVWTCDAFKVALDQKDGRM